MATVTLLLLLLLALILAARTQRLPQVKLYLWVEFWGNLLLFPASWVFGWESISYTLLYGLGQLAVFSSFWHIVRREATALNVTIFVTLWSSVGYFAFRGNMAHSAGNLVVLVEAVGRIALAMALGVAVPHSTHRRTYGTLVLLWLALGVYDFGFLLYTNHWIWNHWAPWMPGLLCVAGFGWLALTNPPHLSPKVSQSH